MAVVYGIDFGTCYSCISVCGDDGHPTIVPSPRGTNTTPSVVMFNTKKDGLPIVGQTAKNLFTNPKAENVVAFAKTELVNENTANEYIVRDGEKRHLSTIEPVACIIYSIFSFANEQRKGQGLPTTSNAVITVPAVCSDIQREKTKLSAELSGINVLQVINEPTAAAISYNIAIGETLLVFDLGGGTLDVSIIKRLSQTDYKVLSSEGNSNLGGKDWDRKLLQLCFENLEWDIAEPTTHQLVAIEQSKIDLCVAKSTEITLVNPTNGVTETLTIDLAEFEQYSSDLIDNAMRVIDMAISSAKSEDDTLNIDRICLAGGSSKMPSIKKAVQKHLPNIMVELNDPDQAIAKGAAKFGLSLITGGNGYELNVDDRGHAYGLVTMAANSRLVIKNLISRNDPIMIEHRSLIRYMPQTSNKLHIQIIENDSNLETIQYRQQSTFFDGDIAFPKEVKIGEAVEIILSRDKNGIVHLTTKHEGCQTKFEFATKVNDIPDDIKARVLEHIKKMSK